MASLPKIADAFRECSRLHYQLALKLDEIYHALTPPPRPGAFTIRATGETHSGDESMPDTIKFVVVLPEEGTPDVVSRFVTVGFQDGTSDTDTVDGRAAGESKEFAAPQDSTISVRVVNVDDAGNESEPRDQEFTVADTIAPPQPGEVGLRATGEEHETG